MSNLNKKNKKKGAKAAKTLREADLLEADDLDDQQFQAMFQNTQDWARKLHEYRQQKVANMLEGKQTVSLELPPKEMRDIILNEIRTSCLLGEFDALYFGCYYQILLDLEFTLDPMDDCLVYSSEIIILLYSLSPRVFFYFKCIK